MYAPSRCSDHQLTVFVICVLLIPLCSLWISSQLTFRWWQLSIYTSQVTFFFFCSPRYLSIYLKSSGRLWGARLFWENLWWLMNPRRLQMNSSFTDNLRLKRLWIWRRNKRQTSEGGWGGDNDTLDLIWIICSIGFQSKASFEPKQIQKQWSLLTRQNRKNVTFFFCHNNLDLLFLAKVLKIFNNIEKVNFNHSASEPSAVTSK